MGWEELVSCVERRELFVIHYKCGKRLSCSVGIKYVTLSLR